ncbi:type VI secretion system baseplate subunit TssF [Burkholderia cepacia]|uniref:type VI secretion system baseplate subunit TssF n=1 Tax=Burkholderia cepacia TaxID=292 RepID=UPI002E7A438E|nr:type VI secretion system baseplate subunit TssF [Burkholderia cepacia]
MRSAWPVCWPRARNRVPWTLFDQLTAPLTMPRGTLLDANAAPRRFRTVHDVTLAPLRVHSARFATATMVPAAVRLPANCRSSIAYEFVLGLLSNLRSGARGILSGSRRTRIAAACRLAG